MDDDDLNISSAEMNKTRVKLNKKRWETLRDVFREITKVPIRKGDNDRLFEKSVVKTKRSGHKELWYDGKKIYYKIRGKNTKWTEYAEFKKGLENPMLVEFEKAKEKFNNSPRAQVHKAAGVDISAETIDDKIRNVLYDLGGDLPEKFMEQETDTVTPPTEKTKTVDVEKLQARLRTQETVIGDMKENIRKKDYELNKLRLESVSKDVIASKEQEINGLQEKLKEAEEQRGLLLDTVLVNDKLLNDEKEKVRSLRVKTEMSKKSLKNFQKQLNKKRKMH